MHDDFRNSNALKHIHSYCKEIERTLAEINHSREKFDKSSTHRNALALCVLQIGELVGILDDGFKGKHSQIPWRDIKQMRNIVAHRYGSFDFDILWEVVTDDILKLKDFCEVNEAKNKNIKL
ncbi:MAG: DUF86 domain-containing protein [Lentihominibacter sp.]|jgi:uncharacterized protein with HEPN domain